MKQFIPHNDVVLCILASNNKRQTSTGFVYESNDIPLYKIIDIGPMVNGINIHIGDIIVVNSTGTKATLNGIDYYFFKEENIAAKMNEC